MAAVTMPCAFARPALRTSARAPRRPLQTRRSVAAAAFTSENPAKICVLGASGYTGADVTRLLACHPQMKITAMTAESNAGKLLADIYPHLLNATDVPRLIKNAEVDWSQIDGAFCCLPHATTQEIVKTIPKHVKIVDLSADFRLSDVETYATWYGGAHLAPELQKEAVYGLTELNREAVRGARLVANPGCYPTSVQLPLVPLLRKGMISTNNIFIDSKSGVTGAGRSAKVGILFCEVSEGMHGYGVGSHRHMPEIEQELSKASGKDVRISFTPHLIPMNRGMLSTIYVGLEQGQTVDGLRAELKDFYATERFVTVMDKGQVPHTRYVRGSNYNYIGVFEDRLPGRAIIMSVIDNVVKGASGQAVQNMNLVLGLDEGEGLMQQPMFP
ncbi:unnamed protein product [Pedinophyceae sp. YPF-701]|nr:unnamed protein product [Pedinophyceae sp. YPF-701]